MRLKLFAAAAILSVLGAPAMAATSLPKACPTVAERNAERVRNLQTELMIAALKCRNSADASLTEPYNAFVRKYSATLLTQSNVLQAYFKRQYGSGYLRQFDRYITQLANEISQRSQRVPQYCQSIRPLLASAMAYESTKLTSFDPNLPPTRVVAQSPSCPIAPDLRTASIAPPAKTATVKAAAGKTTVTKTASTTKAKSTKPAAKPATPKPVAKAEPVKTEPVASAN